MKTIFKHRFVENIPEEKEEGFLYISMEYGTAIHKCVCGCGNDVVTPLSPNLGWQLTYDGETISLNPSIGNWYFPCKTHYWIKNNKIVLAKKLNKGVFENNQKPKKGLKKKGLFRWRKDRLK
jgi:hypothetical protein